MGEHKKLPLLGVIPLAYEITSTPDDYFKSAPPKVKVQYLCNVLRKKYLVSINTDVLASAFSSMGQFDSFWSSVLTRLYADLEEDDKEEIIAAIEAVVEGGNMYLLPVTRPVDSPTALAFSKELDVLSRDLSFRRSRNYNHARAVERNISHSLSNLLNLK